MKNTIYILIFLLLGNLSVFSYAANTTEETMKEDTDHVKRWNLFVERIYTLHLQAVKHADLAKKTTSGGYGSQWKNFYIEESFYLSKTGKLISRIQWERKNPANIHLIEFYIYDDKNRVKVDYLAAYLPQGRNAPVQTLINIHHYDDQLHAFRQFDANGELIHEQCEGKFFDQPIIISLDDDEIYDRFSVLTSEMEKEAYTSCFQYMSRKVGKYQNPLAQNPYQLVSYNTVELTDESLQQQLDDLSGQIKASPDKATLLITRGKLYFQARQFEKSVADHTRAIELDATQDEAWFGRGMSLGRLGDISAGIADLTKYIQRNPESSVAYTKRGVRNIWAGNMAAAKADLKRATELDKTNSEAHDDLGVVYSSEKNYLAATYHFKQAIKHDPTYEKAWHNLATAYALTENLPQALDAINTALRLAPDDKDSLLLKSMVLSTLGHTQEAAAIREHAEYLPDGNWSERLNIQ